MVLAGGLDLTSTPAVKRTAPTLILHGEKDERVAVSAARQFKKELESAGGTPQMHLYPGEGHILTLPAFIDVIARGTAFFQAQLRPQ